MYKKFNQKVTTPPYNQKIAFTLAEVLIALVVIGIIAAITLTTVMPNIQERVNSQRQANIVYKVTQATNLMKANGAMINGFESTDAFVDELQKYLKIMKRCDSEHIADCWPVKTITDGNGDKYEVKDAKTRGDLGFKTYKEVNNVGIVLSDGASLIMTYDPSNTGFSITDKILTTNKELPVGGKYKEFLEYTTNTTAGLAFVMDVNGGRGPNREIVQEKKFDIRNLNGARFRGCPGTKVAGSCFVTVDSIETVNCTRDGIKDNPENAKYCGVSGWLTNDRWAGAMKACIDIDMELPDIDKLKNICDTQRNKLGIYRYNYYSSTNSLYNFSFVDFSNCKQYNNFWTKDSQWVKVLCVEKSQ